MPMPPIPLPVSKIWVRGIMSALGIFLMALSAGSFSTGQPFDGLVLFSVGGITLLIGAVYLADWYENIDYGLRIIELIFITAIAGGASGFVLYGPRGSIGGMLLVGFAAEVAGAFCAAYSHYKDKNKTEKHQDNKLSACSVG